MEEYNEEGRIPEKKSVYRKAIIWIVVMSVPALYHVYKSWVKEQDKNKAESTVIAPPAILEQDQQQSTIEKWQELYINPQSASASEEDTD